MGTLAIGERKVFSDVTLEVVSVHDSRCSGCWFYDQESECDTHKRFEEMGQCASAYRIDHTNVIFKEVTNNQ